jgi:predicted ATPase
MSDACAGEQDLRRRRQRERILAAMAFAGGDLPEIIASRYRPIRLIATGGVGAVYEVEHARTGEHLALKVLLLGVGSSPEAIARFRREARASASIKSEHVVRVTDADVAPELGGAPFLVMELLDGMDLERAAAAAAPTPATVVKWLKQVAQAIDKAHGLGIVHRDLKPENLFLASAENRPAIVKVLDFGIAKMIEEGTGATGTGQILGTPKYMAPEQATPNAPTTPATDRYALGLIAYRLLLGESYYQGGVMSILGQLLHGQLQPPSERGSHFGSPFDAWFAKACHRNPENRFVSAFKQIEALAEAVGLPNVGGDRGDVTSSATGARSSVPQPETKTMGRPLPATNHVLPTQATPFVGREQELAELAGLLTDPGVRLVTIVGAGGMGKSRLAIEAGRLMSSGLAAFEEPLSGQDRFRGRVCLVELAPIGSPDLVVSAIAEAIGLQFYPGGEPRAQLLGYLRERTLVLVMDNFEHVLEAADLVDQILEAAPGVKMIATSRERLGLSREHLFGLSGLSVPDREAFQSAAHFSAIKLFAQSARRAKLDFDLTPEAVVDVARICRLVSGMPLGIVLAASWASLLSPKEIGDEIAASFDFLKTALRDVPERQHSLRVVFDHSWKMFGAEERAVFSRLSVFRGGFTRAAAQVIAGADLQALLALANKSFITRNAANGRYEIHELLRQYAESRLRDQPEEHDRTVDRYGAYFAAFLHGSEAGLKGPSPEIAANEIETELDNVRAAWSRLVERRQLEQVSVAIEALNLFYTLRSSFAEAEAAFKAAAQAFSVPRPERGSEGARLAGLALALQASHCDSRWRHQEAIALSVKALDLLEESRHPRETAYALFTWGFALVWAGSKQQGFEASERALDLYRTTDDRWGAARALNLVGLHYRDWAGPIKAEACYRESIAIQQSFGDRTIVMPHSLMGLGYVRTQQGDYAEGCRRLLEALAISEKRADRWCESLCLQNLAQAHKKMGEYETAEGFARRALVASRGIFDFAENWGHLTLAEILIEQGRLDEATEHYQTSLVSENPRTAATARRGLGDIAWGRGDVSEARRCFLESLAVFENLGTTWGIAETSNRLAYLACHEGQNPKARGYFRRALAFERQSWPFVIDVVAGIALLLVRIGESQCAAELLAFARHHSATERHTLVRRVEPLLAELVTTLPANELAAALERGKRLDIEALAHDALALMDDSVSIAGAATT